MKKFTFSPFHSHLLLVIIVASVSALSACSYTNGYDAKPVVQCKMPTTVSFKVDVQPILVQNCRNSCHNSTDYRYYGNFNMDDLKQIQYYAQPANGINGVPFLIGNIRHDPGFVAMPQGGGKLADCDIALIKAWVDAGAPNN